MWEQDGVLSGADHWRHGKRQSERQCMCNVEAIPEDQHPVCFFALPRFVAAIPLQSRTKARSQTCEFPVTLCDNGI
ncbi:hypothetical protein G7K_6091-t1 [Saitoella complicata NRRL Y-17804]|uniref:Uncharacterized protein n=1 Tax=Saitoella complicata (strain BCRC 22490 / CBS 7301 / JCM 7358 / NBRC 10748 / NRRL Y-17804) TaxID=698492 RepID=A0A0E9NQC9_SAICN|nr:hypothetical protein G7K_6091-t1 [Saitoella complicata NRRL Y-17804]